LEWARKADAGPFSSLGIIDRVVYGNHEPLMALAACAGATRRVRLMPTVLLATLRDATILAKEAATLDSLSGGRLSLGMGVGYREDDFKAVSADRSRRGQHFEEQMATMRRVWAGEKIVGGVGPVGPAPARPGGPEVLIGALEPAAVRRAGRLADGFLSSVDEPKNVAARFQMVEEEWKAAGRTGKPRLVGGVYYTLGDDAVERGKGYMFDYYSFLGKDAKQVVADMVTTPKQVRQTLKDFNAIGMDEMVFHPCVSDVAQLERLADFVS
jgi:alkanesulfonate monooxygenase SsuD/methylene tetrahydromethanopterin reductase-like flavin-dependent oxidoreductase (luciferase family)